MGRILSPPVGRARYTGDMAQVNFHPPPEASPRQWVEGLNSQRSCVECRVHPKSSKRKYGRKQRQLPIDHQTFVTALHNGPCWPFSHCLCVLLSSHCFGSPLALQPLLVSHLRVQSSSGRFKQSHRRASSDLQTLPDNCGSPFAAFPLSETLWTLFAGC